MLWREPPGPICVLDPSPLSQSIDIHGFLDPRRDARTISRPHGYSTTTFMPPGLISLPLRSSPTRRALLQTAVHLSHGTLGQQPAPPHRSSHTAAAATPTTANTTAPDNMLGKAAKAYGANAPPPSSSASKPTANSDIRDRFKKPTPASAGTEQDDNLSSQYWQRSLSQQSQQQSQRGANHGALASLYSCGDSFREEQQPQPQPQKQQLPARQQNVVDLTGSSFNDPASKPKAKAQPEVFFVEDDFSDDNDLDLDFEAPSALPPMPKKAAEPAAKENVPPPQPSTQEVEWSSSPASHFQAPKREETQPAASLKRQSSGESDSVPQPPPAKKRTLPASFREPAPVQPSSAMTPAHNSKKDFLDPTASAIKEQRRLLKDKRQADTAVEIPETFAEDEQSHGAGVQVSAVNLSGEQRKVLDVVVKQGKSVFFTGPAGTGKSVLMRAIIKDLKEKFARDPERVAVTASTGLAACNIGGMTLHSFSGTSRVYMSQPVETWERFELTIPRQALV